MQTSPTFENQEFLFLEKSRRKTELQAALIFVLLALLSRWNIWQVFGSHLLGGSSADGGLYYYIFQKIISGSVFKNWYSLPNFYPFGYSLAWSDNFLLPGMAGWLLSCLGLSTIAAYNFIFLLAHFLNGYCTFRLAYSLSGHFAAATIAGAAFMLNPYLLSVHGHPQLMFAFFLPLAMLCYFHYIRSCGRALPALLLGLVTLSCFLSCVYYAIFIVLMIGLLCLAGKLLKPHYHSLKLFLRLAAFASLPLLLAYSLWQPYLQTLSTFGPRKLYEAAIFSADSFAFISAAPLAWLYGKFLPESLNSEANFFCGLSLCALALIAIFRVTSAKALGSLRFTFLIVLIVSIPALSPTLRNTSLYYLGAIASWFLIAQVLLSLRQLGKLESAYSCYIYSNRSMLATFIFLAVAFFTLSFGPLGNPAIDQLPLGPYALLYKTLPAIASIRATARFAIVAFLALSLLYAFILPWLGQRYNFNRKQYAVILLVIALECWPATYAREALPLPPTALASLSEQGLDNTTVLALPLVPDRQTNFNEFPDISKYAELTVNYMNWLAPYPVQVVNGYSGLQSELIERLPERFSSFPDARSMQMLAAFPNLNYILLHEPETFPGYYSRVRSQLAGFPELVPVFVDDVDRSMLLSFKPETLLTSSFRLLAPKTKGGRLNLSLMGSYKKESSGIALSIFVEEFSLEQPFVQLIIPADGLYHEYELALPESNDQIKPFRLSFTAGDAGQVYLGARIFIAR